MEPKTIPVMEKLVLQLEEMTWEEQREAEVELVVQMEVEPRQEEWLRYTLGELQIQVELLRQKGKWEQEEGQVMQNTKKEKDEMMAPVLQEEQ